MTPARRKGRVTGRRVPESAGVFYVCFYGPYPAVSAVPSDPHAHQSDRRRLEVHPYLRNRPPPPPFRPPPPPTQAHPCPGHCTGRRNGRTPGEQWVRRAPYYYELLFIIVIIIIIVIDHYHYLSLFRAANGSILHFVTQVEKSCSLVCQSICKNKEFNFETVRYDLLLVTQKSGGFQLSLIFIIIY